MKMLLKKAVQRLTRNECEIKQGLLESGIPEDRIDDAIIGIKEEITKVPLPKIALIGFTGVGKSSTLNALFNAGQPTSDVKACTQKEAPIIGDVSKYTGSRGSIIVYDMPGLGEDLLSDKQHYQTYLQVLPVVDVAIWTFHTGDRAMTPMQDAMTKLSNSLGHEFEHKLMFAINKADAIAPGESYWNQLTNSPSSEQKHNIEELEEYIIDKIHQVLPGWKGPIVTYSAKTRYRLESLITAMISVMPNDRRWLLDSVADVADPIELMDPRIKQYILEKRSNGEWAK